MHVIQLYILRVLQYSGEPTGQSKIQRMSKNKQYYMLKCLVSYLLSNCFNSEFGKHIKKKKAQKMCGIYLDIAMHHLDFTKRQLDDKLMPLQCLPFHMLFDPISSETWLYH